MKRIARVSLLFSVLFSVLAAVSCGGGGSSTTTAASTSKLKKRAIVANNSGNVINLVDATKDELTAFTFGAASVSPKFLVPSGTGKTLVYYSADNSVSTTDNTTEQATQVSSAFLQAPASEIVASQDGKAAYAALPPLGVSVVDLTGTTAYSIKANIPVPSIRRIVLSHNGNKLLAFSDGVDTLTLINTSDNTATTVSGFDRPVYGVFSTDDSKAYILSCGAECGGTQAKVTVLDVASATPGTSVNVPAATVGILDGSSLYVAGSLLSGTAPLGRFTVLDAGSLAVSKTVNIGDGFHTVISVPSSGKAVVGARTCSTGCTSIVDASGGTASISTPTGDTVSIAPITNRSVVYVIEGNELVIYDLTTGKPQSKQVDIVGTPTAVLYIGPQ